MGALLGILVLVGFGYFLYTVWKKPNKYPTTISPPVPDVEPDPRKDKR